MWVAAILFYLMSSRHQAIQVAMFCRRVLIFNVCHFFFATDSYLFHLFSNSTTRRIPYCCPHERTNKIRIWIPRGSGVCSDATNCATPGPARPHENSPSLSRWPRCMCFNLPSPAILSSNGHGAFARASRQSSSQFQNFSGSFQVSTHWVFNPLGL